MVGLVGPKWDWCVWPVSSLSLPQLLGPHGASYPQRWSDVLPGQTDVTCESELESAPSHSLVLPESCALIGANCSQLRSGGLGAWQGQSWDLIPGPTSRPS